MFSTIRILAMNFSIMALLCLGQQAQAQTFVELESETPHLRHGLTAKANLQQSLNEQWGVNALFLTTGQWAEAYAGPVWKKDSTAFSLSIGGEQGPDGFAPRYGMFAWVTHGHCSFLGIAEANNDTFRGYTESLWYDLNLMYEANHHLAVGLKDRRSVGAGPLLEGGTQSIKLWLQWAFIDAEAAHTDLTRFGFGIKYNL